MSKEKYTISKELGDKEIDIFEFGEGGYKLFLTVKFDDFDEENKELQKENCIKNVEMVINLLNENEDLINGNYHSVYSEPKEHCMGHQLIYKKGDETILAETFCDAVAKIIVKAMNENEDKPKIDKENLQYAIDCIKVVLGAINDEQHKDYLNKAIQNLPTEEN
jgi:hypothetical protein